MHQLRVSSDEETRTLVMQREEARVLINLGNAPRTFAMLKGEKKSIASREGLKEENGQLELPPMTLAVLLSPSEEVENRLVARRK